MAYHISLMTTMYWSQGWGWTFEKRGVEVLKIASQPYKYPPVIYETNTLHSLSINFNMILLKLS